MGRLLSCSREVLQRVALTSVDRWVASGLGVLFIVAAFLKASHGGDWSPPTGAPAGALLVALITFEFVLGLGLLLNIAPRITWLASLLAFSAFAAYSLRAVLDGRASCGCFGAAEIDPRITLGLDVVVVAALLVTGWRQLAPCVRRPNLAYATAPCAFILVAGTAGWLAGAWNAVAGGLGSTDLVILEPEQWIGRRFPLLDHIETQSDLSKEKWRVLLYHHNCPKCDAALTTYTRLVPANGWSLAAIELPPYAGTPRALGAAQYGRLIPSRTWFVTTPCELELEDGRVARVASSEEKIAHSKISF